LKRPLRVVTRTEPPTGSNCKTIFEANGLRWDDNIDFLYSPRLSGRLVDVAPDDIFITTSWWSTWATRASCRPTHIIYLVQEDERRFYPEGDDSVRCAEVLADPAIHHVVNSKPLFDHLSATGAIAARRALWFEPAFPSYRTSEPPARSGKHKFIFYARPNNPRNLYFRGLEAISSAIESGHLPGDEWDLYFIGKHLAPVRLPAGATPALVEKLDWNAYHDLLRHMDLGFSLMASPHPSYPPLDMAAAGAVVVTNAFGQYKQSLAGYSANIICSGTDLGSLARAMQQGVGLAMDIERRRSNHVNSRFRSDWHDTLSATCVQLARALVPVGVAP